MKNLRNKIDVEKALELKEVIDQRKDLEKKEKALKEHFKVMNENALKVGDILITFDDAKRTGLDKKSLAEKLGDKLKEFETITTYKKMSVKNVA
jgi:site-specific recombinase XerC